MINEHVDDARNHMLDFLRKAAPAWYPGKAVKFSISKEYTSFNATLKSEILYAGFDVLAPAVTLRARNEGGRCIVAFDYDSKAQAPQRGFGRFLQERGVIRDVKQSSLQYIYMPGDPLDYSCSFKAGTMTMECLYKESSEFLVELSIALVAKDDMDRKRILSVQAALSENILDWLNSRGKIVITLQNREGGAWNMTAEEAVSSVGLDASLDSEHRVFRWKEDTFNNECTACPMLEKTEALAIVAEAGITIPPDIVLIGFQAARPEEKVQCYTMRYEHRIKDATEDFRKDDMHYKGSFPKEYKNPGSIVVEGDFYVIYLDSQKKRVIGGHRKWRPVSLA